MHGLGTKVSLIHRLLQGILISLKNLPQGGIKIPSTQPSLAGAAAVPLEL